MADKKKKRKLQIDKVGAGDPTFIFRLTIANEDGSNNGSSDTIPDLNINAILSDGTNQQTALNYSGDLSFVLGEPIDFLASFNARENNLPAQIPATISFEAEDYEFTIENDTGISGGIKNQTLELSNIVLEAPVINNLSSGGVFAFHSTNGNGNNAFLSNVVPKTGSLINPVVVNEQILVSTNLNFCWHIYSYSNQYGGSYTFNNIEKGWYLSKGKDSLDLTYFMGGGSNDPAQMYWIIEQMGKYTVSIKNAQQYEGQDVYLYNDTDNQEVILSPTPSSWYLHDLTLLKDM